MAAPVALHPVPKGNSLKSTADFALAWMKLTNFRNYPALSLPHLAGQIVLCGPNGAGKTNILEAISLLAPGRGLRRAARGDLACTQPASYGDAQGRPAVPLPDVQWGIAAEIHTPDGPVQLGTGSLPEETRRAVRINGAPAPQTHLSSLCAISWLTPQMDGLFLDSPSARRRFLDRLAISFDPAHAGRLTRYDKAFRERGKLLNERPDEQSWLASLEASLAETGVAIMATRAALVADLNSQLETEQTGFPRAHIKLQGGSCEGLNDRPALAIEDEIKATAAANRAAGESAMPGPHASDMLVWHQEEGQLAHLCSTGQQKALLIALVLAHADLQGQRLHRPPILLLDDVAAHLDAKRRALLFERCRQSKGQVWYSGTDRDLFAEIAANMQFIELQDGQIC